MILNIVSYAARVSFVFGSTLRVPAQRVAPSPFSALKISSASHQAQEVFPWQHGHQMILGQFYRRETLAPQWLMRIPTA